MDSFLAAATERFFVTKPNVERLRELFCVRADGALIRRNTFRRNAQAGSIAGCLHHTGYVYVRVDGHRLPAHHIVWAIEHDCYPALDLDHINGKRADNRVQNLREVSRSVNSQNRRKANRNGSSGLLGAHKRLDGYVAVVYLPTGRRIERGIFPTAVEAHEAYIELKRRFHEGCTL